MRQAKRPKVFGVRDFPPGCGTLHFVDPTNNNDVAITSETKPNLRIPSYFEDKNANVEAIALPMKEATPNDITLSHENKTGSFVFPKKDFPLKFTGKVKFISEKEAMELAASQNIRHQFGSTGNTYGRILQPSMVQKYRNLLSKKKFNNDSPQKENVSQSTYKYNDEGPSRYQLDTIPNVRKNQLVEVVTHAQARSLPKGGEEVSLGDHNLRADTTRAKVLDTVRLYKDVFRKLSQENIAWHGGPRNVRCRIDYDTRAALVNMGKVVNVNHRIGPVPGIKIGDVFQYKTELSVVGLHFKMQGGIDYMKIRGKKIATSIVVSEGNGYGDNFNLDDLIYTGEGGNVICRNKIVAYDQKLIKGNMALANSLREKSVVRVIRGHQIQGMKGKNYVYEGLYVVREYWQEQGPRCKNVFKFRLFRVPGQHKWEDINNSNHPFGLYR